MLGGPKQPGKALILIPRTIIILAWGLLFQILGTESRILNWLIQKQVLFSSMRFTPRKEGGILLVLPIHLVLEIHSMFYLHLGNIGSKSVLFRSKCCLPAASLQGAFYCTNGLIPCSDHQIHWLWLWSVLLANSSMAKIAASLLKASSQIRITQKFSQNLSFKSSAYLMQIAHISCNPVKSCSLPSPKLLHICSNVKWGQDVCFSLPLLIQKAPALIETDMAHLKDPSKTVTLVWLLSSEQ